MDVLNRRMLWSALSLLIVAPGLVGGRAAWAQDEAAVEAREAKAVERFQTLLEKSPRRGTALDRVYGYHVERGTLDALIQGYRDRVETDPKDGTAWLIVGLLELQRGRDAAAVQALREAEKTRPDDALPAYYLGQALVLVGQPDGAAEAFERAIARKPPRNELLEIFQALGRVHQRAQHPEKALAVWERLETLFPDDARVQEEIAIALAEEAEPARALERYEALAKSATDPFRKVQYRLDAAELKVRLGKKPEALKDFEVLLGQLNPDSWLHREVRRKVEEVFLKADDQAGLAAYYEAWVKAHPDDVDAMARLGRALAAQGRAADARQWFDAAVKKAPSRRELRLALVEQLVQERKFAEAAAQYEAMAKAEPGNPDVIREWGRLLLRDSSRPEAERKKAAAAVWKRLVAARPKDAATAVQVADLLRGAELPDEAIPLYRKAIELDPSSPQYREYLGEYFHALKRPADALATWGAMAAGPNRSSKTLGRLAEVLAGFGYKAEALKAIEDACALEPDDFDLQFKRAVLLHQSDRFADAVRQLDVVETLADSDEQAGAVLEEQIKNYQADHSLGERAEALGKELTAGKDATAARWRRLARLLEASQQLAEAGEAARKALEIDPRSVPGWALAARVAEASGDLGTAAAANRKLAEIDRRARAEYLRQVATLEQRLGRRDEALKAGRELLAASPGNPETYSFFAELCFQLGQNDEGLDALRRAVRANPADTKPILALASTLAEQFRTEEAIELLWQAFDRTRELDGRLGIISRLTDLYLQRNQFDRLIGRLELRQREPEAGRDLALCLAQAHAASGDYGTARSVLEKLLASNARDTGLLAQLAGLAETEGDYALAARYQKQLDDLAPSDEGKARLAQLYARAGELEEAEALWARLAAGESDPARALQALDSLAHQGKAEAVLALADRLLARDPKDWEVIYRQATALNDLPGRQADAAARSRDLLALSVPDDEPSTAAKQRKKNPTASRPVGTTATPPRPTFGLVPLRDRLNLNYMIRSAAGLEGRNVNAPTFTPADFGQARMVALGMLLAQAQKDGKADAFLKAAKAATEAAPGDARAWWERYYLDAVRNDFPALHATARAMAGALPGDAAAQYAFLQSLPNRTPNGNGGPVWGRMPGTADNVPPMAEGDLRRVLDAQKSLRARRPEWVNADILTNVADELKRAGRDAEARDLYREAVASAATVDAVNNAMQLAAERGDVDGSLELFERYERLLGNQTKPIVQGIADPLDGLSKLMAVRALDDDFGDVLKILDRYLEISRRRERVTALTRTRLPIFSSPWNQQNQYSIWVGPAQTHIQLDYPPPNDHFDYGAIMLLRNAFEYYRRADVLTDLLAHFRDQIPAADKSGLIDPRLALGYLLWWDGQAEEAMAELAAVADRTADVGLRLDLAELRERRGERGEALALADAVEPLDQKMMQRRENLALRVAVATGDVDRARRAAERLFNLRLDSNTQLALSAQMHQLGMHDLAEAVLGRARRRAGSRTASLVALMHAYQQQNKMDLAVQAAHLILRTAPQQANAALQGNVTAEDNARQQAIQLLARSGRLKEMIARVEAQAAAAPQSLGLLKLLADYYRAAGEPAKAKEVAGRMIAARPDDVRLRYLVAQQMMQSGDVPAAIEQYRAAIPRDPALFGQYYNVVQQAFVQAGKLGELIDLVEAVDPASFGINNWVYTNLVQIALNDASLRVRGMALFRKAWAALPAMRPMLINVVQDESLWRLPEMYDYTLAVTLPPAGSAPASPWQGVETVTGYTNDGRLLSLTSRLLDLAAGQGKLDDLDARIARLQEQVPGWEGGRALRILARLRRGKLDAAASEMRALLAARGDRPIPPFVAWIIGQEFEDHPATTDLALAVYEQAMRPSEGGADLLNNQFQYSPARRLFELYRRAGRDADARALIDTFAHPKRPREGRARYGQQLNLQHLADASQQLFALGDPVAAVRVFTSIQNDPELMRTVEAQSAQWLAGQAGAALGRALPMLNARHLPAALRALAQPGEDRPGVPALDLGTMVAGYGPFNASVTSLFAEAVESEHATPELRAELRSKLDGLAPREPNDFSPTVARALVASADGKPEAIDAALAALLTQVDSNPLEALPDGARANARQRAAALRQVPLWLVARACWRRESYRAQGDALAARALAAAARQEGNAWSMAMLSEWGQLDLDRGDRDAAERRWGDLLDLVLADPNGRRAAPKAGANGQGAVPFDRFQLAMQVGQHGLDQGMTGLSLRAVREALGGGPPTGANTHNEFLMGGQQLWVSSPAPAMATFSSYTAVLSHRMIRSFDLVQDNGGQQVEAQLFALDRAWRAKGVDDVAIYELLRDVVLPESRPAELFAYPHPLPPTILDRSPRSVGELLVRRAAKAGRLDDLRARLEKRRAQPMAELPALVLLGRVGVESGDAAATRATLEALKDRLDKDTMQPTAELACHAALPALRTDADALARAVVERAARNFNKGGNGNEPGGSLLILLAREAFRRGDPADARARLDEWLATVDALQNLQAEQLTFQRQLALQRAIAELTRAGQLDGALDLLGRYADQPPTRYGTPDATDLVLPVFRMLAARPDRERFDLLRGWSLPASNRKSVRIVATSRPADVPPSAFGVVTVPGDGGSAAVVSSAGLLIEAARAVGALDDLAAEARRAADEKVENAANLLVLVEIARGRGEAVRDVVRTMGEEIEKRWKPPVPAGNTGAPVARGKSVAVATLRGSAPNNVAAKAVEWPEALVARAAAADSALRPLGLAMLRALLDQARQTNNITLMVMLRRELDLATAAGAVAPDRGPGLALWHPAGGSGGWWVAHDGIIGHLSGVGEDFLDLDVPLTGSYEFTVDSTQEANGFAGLAHGGLLFEPQGPGVSVQPLGRQQGQLAFQQTSHLGADRWNRWTLQVEPGRTRLRIGGHLVFEDDDPSPTSPWLSLFAQSMRRAFWHEPTLSGRPTVPAEVRLSHADRLDGWVTTAFNESQPQVRALHQQAASQAKAPRRGRPAPAPADLDGFDWSSRDGVIVGRRAELSSGEEGRQSLIQYRRPMRPGESLTYEFLYEPDATMVHPCLGRVAVLLGPEGVRLHWITRTADGDWTGLAADNVADPPADSRRGPRELPLRPGAWNVLRIDLADDRATFTLNDMPIYEHILRSGDGREFGLFHDKAQTEARARNVVLAGPWAERLAQAQAQGVDLARGDDQAASPAEQRARAELIGESFFALEALDRVRGARDLTAAERVKRLAGWVLPGDGHASFRLYGESIPFDAAPPVAWDEPDVPPPAVRVHTGGELQFPAVELARAAKECGQIGELRKRVESFEPKDDLGRRNRLAMLALLAIADEQDGPAGELMEQLLPLLKAVPEEAPILERWAELAVTQAALQRPALLPRAIALADVMVDQFQKHQPGEHWEPRVRHVRARALVLSQPEDRRPTFGAPPAAPGWKPVTTGRAFSRGHGYPRPHWAVADRTATHSPGHYYDYLYYDVPLRGDFELECELSSFGWREGRIAYAATWVGVMYERDKYELGHFGRFSPQGIIDPPLPELGDWYKYRLVVKDGNYAAFVDGRKVHEQHLPDEPDPWLAIYTWVNLTGGARNLAIRGNPTIPDRLDLSKTADLTGWLAEYYGENVGPNANWQKRGEEIYGRCLSLREPSEDAPVNLANNFVLQQQNQNQAIRGSKLESLLQYHRPMLEDGEIRYEFYYIPGRTDVHPALDRLALLLRPEGVKAHWLTDAQFDRTHLAPDNEAVEPDHRRGPDKLPLKANDWNAVRLAIKGDTLSLELNGELIYERPLERTNQRVFGLFHYADETDVRVRNVSYRGDWPKSLPPTQPLAPAGGGAP